METPASEANGGLQAPLGTTRNFKWHPEAAISLQIALSAAFFLALTLLVLGPTFFRSGDLVFSEETADLAKQFVHWRAFGFGELRAGHLALWNPYIFCGTPFFGGFQSALLYPPNWLYLCLPLAPAINIGIALHVFLAGFFMHLWVRWRGLHPLACLLAGVLFMFSGPYFLHIYAGHLSNLCTMVWGPLIFLAIDGWLERRTSGWLWLGMGAVAMQILAGHPQYVFYTGVAAGLYGLCHLVTTSHRVQALAGFAVIVVGAVGLSAVQLFEGFHVAGETVRNHGTSMAFAAVFSFPLENCVTVLVPGFFGDANHFTYWGRFHLWEMSLFCGVTGLALAVYGLIYGEPSKKRFCGPLAAVLLVLAFGANTPLFSPLYHYTPGFGRFRGWSKFIYPASLFLIVLAATGFDATLRGAGRGPGRPTAFAVLLGAVVAGCFAVWAYQTGVSGTGPWRAWIRSRLATGDLYEAQNMVETTGFAAHAARFAATQLWLTSATLLAISVVLFLASRYPKLPRALLLIATVEMVVFAHSTLVTFRLSDALDAPPDLPAGDYRVLNEESPDLGMSTGTRDIWGYDPGVLRRYAEWIAVSQGLDSDDASETVKFWNYPPHFAALLRCRTVLPPTGPDGEYSALPLSMGEPAKQLTLISEARVVPNRDDLLEAIRSEAFDPRKSVLLETPPVPPPAPGASSGTVRLLNETSDTLTITADVPRAAILLITDAYCTGWRAYSLLPEATTPQWRYDVLPADYFLRAVPLRAGRHLFRLEYRPMAFEIGKWVSLASLTCYVVGAASLVFRRRLFLGPLE